MAIIEIKKKQVEKEEFLSELEKIDSEIKSKISKILDNDGQVYGLKDKKVLKAVYLFKNTTEENKKILIFTEAIKVEDIDDKKIKECEEQIKEELQEQIIERNFEKAKWNDIEVVYSKSKAKKYFWIAVMFPICLVLGMAIGGMFGHMFVGMGIGIFLGLLFGIATSE